MPERFLSELLFHGELLIGWIVDPDDLSRRFVAEIDRNDDPFTSVRADAFVPRLRNLGYGDGCYGFAVSVEEFAETNRAVLDRFTLRVANDAAILAAVSRSTRAGDDGPRLGGFVSWRGGLRLVGELRGRVHPGVSDRLQAFEGSSRLDVSVTFSPGEKPGESTLFDLFLPSKLLDGRLHSIRVLGSAEAELDGSPVWIVADKGGFRALAGGDRRPAERRSDFDERMLDYLDKLVPAAAPFEFYGEWAGRFPTEAISSASGGRTVAVVIVGRAASAVTLASLRSQTGGVAVKVGILDVDADWRFPPSAWYDLEAVLRKSAKLDALLVVREGTTLDPNACRNVVEAIGSGPAKTPARVCLADHLLFDAQGRHGPFFTPAFDFERTLSQGYPEGVFAVSPEALVRMDLGDEPCSTYDLLLAALETAGAPAADRIVHIPQITASVPQRPIEAIGELHRAAVRRHLGRSGVAADLEPRSGSVMPALAVLRRPVTGTVDVVVPTRDRLDLLKPCLESLFRTMAEDCRIVVIDNGSVEGETIAYLRAVERDRGVAVLRDDGVFNFSRLNNAAVRRSEADFVCFLNNDVEVVSPNWLTSMRRYFSRTDVAGVGAKLVWPNRMLQHGGVVLGTGFAASHAYDRYLADEAGYMDGIRVARECSALTAACLLVRRSDFLAVGGFDETAFPVAFNDVDLCLKLRAMGKVLIWTPDAELLHKESASRGRDADRRSAASRAAKELAQLRSKWGEALASDPYYNPNLNLEIYAYTGLAVPPRERGVRRNEAARPSLGDSVTPR